MQQKAVMKLLRDAGAYEEGYRAKSGLFNEAEVVIPGALYRESYMNPIICQPCRLTGLPKHLARFFSLTCKIRTGNVFS